jgi:hypothetical protein
MKSRQSTGSSWVLPNRPATTFLKLKPFLEQDENFKTVRLMSELSREEKR